MQTFNNLKTGIKLISGFVTVALIVVAVAVVGYVNMGSINAGMTSLYNNRTVPIEQLGKAEALLFTIRGDLYKYLLLPAERGTIEKAIIANVASLTKEVADNRASFLVQAEQDALAKFDPAWAEYQAAATEVLTLVKAGNETGAIQSIADGGRTANARKAVGAALEALVTTNVQEAEKLKAQGDSTFVNSTLILVIASVFGALLAIGIGAFITWTITGPLSIMTGSLQNLRQGNLNRKLDLAVKQRLTARQDELGVAGQCLSQTEEYLIAMAEAAAQIADNDLTATVMPRCAEDELGQAFAKMIGALRHTVGQVAESAENVSAASEQLAAAANQAGAAAAQQTEATTKTVSSVEEMKRAIDGVAKGAQEQAAAVGRASDISTQMAAAIQQVAGNAQSVTRDSANAAQAARDGARVVADTVKGMDNIKAKVGASAAKVQEMGQRSTEIGAIVETIEDIASQTNLLALNTAIEAARAGEHGKGFAVVADEVRKLAERAGSATKEIGVLIRSIQQTVSDAVVAMKESSQEVETGAMRANEAGRMLENILQAAEAVNQQAEAAYTATQQMGELSTTLASATDAVSAVVEENTASTEQMAAGAGEVMNAIESIASVSEEMNAQVEEVSASASSLSDLAQSLQQVVAAFTLDAAPSATGKPKASAPSTQRSTLRALVAPEASRVSLHGNGRR
jgi:methyl-accepting chemotaxis protein